MASTNWTQIKVVSISDIHLGNAANPSESVIAGLEKKLTYDFLKDKNLLFIVGDVFDRGIPVNHKDVPIIVSWIRRLLSRCARLGIIVVVLEGTPSHDRLQSHLFTALNESAEEQDKCRLHYVKDVSILHIEEYGIDLLCVPDEKNTNDDVTYEQVMSMMQARGIEKVDFGLFHGFFEFQVPAGLNFRHHLSSRYLPIIRYLTFVGHDHTFRQEGRIIIQGSPDRQRHGMEEPKGFVHATIQRDGTYQATFVVNEHAMVFKTIEIDGDLDGAIDSIFDVCDSLRPNSHLCIRANRGHPVLSSLEVFSSKYPFLRITKKENDAEEKVETNLGISEDQIDYVPFTIDQDNLYSVVLERMKTPPVTDEEKRYFDYLIESVKNME